MNKKMKAIALVGVTVLACAAQASTTPIGDSITEVTGYWDTIEPVIIGIATVSLGIVMMKKLRRG